MAKKTKRTIEDVAVVTHIPVKDIPQYVINDKNIFRNMLKRIRVTPVGGREITADSHFMDLIRRLTYGDNNALNHLAKFHPTLWVVRAIGNWEDDFYISNPVTTLGKIQDEWFEVVHANGIYRHGNGMSDYSWDEFKRNWYAVWALPNVNEMSAEDIINWLRVKHEETKDKEERKRLEEQKRSEEMKEKIRLKQEEGARRVKEIEEQKAREAAEEEARLERELKAKEDAQRRAEEEEARAKAEAERKQREEEEEFKRMLAEEEREKKARETAEKRRANINKGREIKLENQKKRKEEALRQAEEAVTSDDSLFFEVNVSPEYDSDIFNDSGVVDFLKPVYRQPSDHEARLDADEGEFRFGHSISKEILDKGFTKMKIEVMGTSYYFTFGNTGNVDLSTKAGRVVVLRKSGVEQMIERLGRNSKCVFLFLSNNKSCIADKLAYLIEKISES